jgi:hypothetical protein
MFLTTEAAGFTPAGFSSVFAARRGDQLILMVLRAVLVLSEGLLFVLRPHQPQCGDGGKGDGSMASRPIRVQPHARRSGISSGPHGRRRPIKVPDSVTDGQAFFLSDIFRLVTWRPLTRRSSLSGLRRRNISAVTRRYKI